MDGMNGMDYVNLYSALMDGIGAALQDALAAIWLAVEADVVAYTVIIGALILVALTVLSASHAERVDEAMRRRMWARIVTYGDAWDEMVASVSASSTDATDAGDNAGDDLTTLQARLRAAEAELERAHARATYHGWKGGPSNRHADAVAAAKSLRRRLARWSARSVARSVARSMGGTA